MEDADLFATHMRRALRAHFSEDADHALRDRAIIISSSYRKAVHLAQLDRQHLGEKLICIFLTKTSIAASPLLDGAHAVECARCFERKFFAHLSSLEDHLWTQDSAALSGKFYSSFLPSHLTMLSVILRRAVRDKNASRKNALLYHFFDGSVRRLAFSPCTFARSARPAPARLLRTSRSLCKKSVHHDRKQIHSSACDTLRPRSEIIVVAAGISPPRPDD